MGSVGDNMIKTVEIVSLSSGIIGETFAAPRCIIPFGVNASVDANEQVIRFE